MDEVRVLPGAILLAALIAALLASSCASLPAPGLLALPPEGLLPSWHRLSGGIEYAAVDLAEPPLELHALRIDLDSPGLRIVVTPASAPGGLTLGRTVSEFASEFGCVAAVNGGPFCAGSGGSQARYMEPCGLCVSDGRLVSAPNPRYAALIFVADGAAGAGRGVGLRASIESQADRLDLGAMRDAVGGFFAVLRGGKIMGRTDRRDPRTAAGVSPDGRTLYILVADGRQRASIGLTEREIGSWLAWLGASDGIELDGGGSSAMALRVGGTTKIVNTPVNLGIPGLQRVVADCLGFAQWD